jgi:hypothetical protein
MNSGIYYLAHQFVVDFTENFANAGECGLFSLYSLEEFDHMQVQ